MEEAPPQDDPAEMRLAAEAKPAQSPEWTTPPPKAWSMPPEPFFPVIPERSVRECVCAAAAAPRFWSAPADVVAPVPPWDVLRTPEASESEVDGTEMGLQTLGD